VLSSAGKAVALSQDHKPDRPDEMDRLLTAGATVGLNKRDAARRSGKAKTRSGCCFSWLHDILNIGVCVCVCV